jgi:lipopolysaccharide export system protein LptA
MRIPHQLPRARRRNLFSFLLFPLVLLALSPGLARAQGPPGSNAPARVFYAHYRNTPQGKIIDALFNGSQANPLPGGLVLVKDFELRGVRDGQTNQVQVLAQAPECIVDYRPNQEMAENAGPIHIFTPTTNLFVQGTGFFYAESNQMLFLSNQVQTRVVKSLLRSGVFPAPKTGAADDAGQILRIFSDRGQLVYRSNLVNYAGSVRVADPQFQMLSPFLSVHFTTNWTVESILAWQDVTITLTNKGTATGATASYFNTNGAELLELEGGAHWLNGPEEAKAARFTYDPNRHFLIADNQVWVLWPNPATNPSAPATFRQLWADHATLQMSTNGATADAMTSEGNVIILNQADHSRALADQAVYNRTNDLIELRGHSVWRNDRMKVQGDLLSMASASTNPIFHAQGNARFKLQVLGQSTNRWIDITSDDILHQSLDAQTNLATFRGHVHARLLKDDQLQDSLTSQLLLVYLDSSNQVETAVARGDVRAETAADAKGVRKTIACGVLTARRSPLTGLWRSVMAEEDVQIQLAGSGPAAENDNLTAAIVTAYFSSVTNVIENAVAVGNVVFDQNSAGQNIHATGDRAVYDLAPAERIVLTGHPVGRKDKFLISNADRLVWDVKSGGLNASGLYHIIPDHNLNPDPSAPSAAP